MIRIAMAVLLCALPAPALAHGVALEMGAVYSGGRESAFRAVADEGNALGEIGAAGMVTLWRRGTLRLDAVGGWSMISSQAVVAESVETDLLQHAFFAGARLRWNRLRWVQPYASVRAGTAFGFFDVDDLEASDWALRAEPALGVELVVPLDALASGRRSLAAPEAGGFGVGLELAYRFQSAYHFEGARPEPGDPDVARDAIPREGADLGDLSMSGLRLGLNLLVRF